MTAPSTPDTPTPPPADAWLDVVWVLGIEFALLLVASRAGLDRYVFVRAPRYALLVHVALNAVVGLALVGVALARRGAPLASAGIRPTRVAPALGWGVLGAVAAYVLQAPIAVAIVALDPAAAARLTAERAAVLARLARLPLALVPVVALLAAVYEEVLFRGFALPRVRAALARRVASPRVHGALAVVLTAALFGAGHAYLGVVGVAQAFVAGVVLGALTLRRGSIAPAVVAHALVDGVSLAAVHALHASIAQVAQHGH